MKALLLGAALLALPWPAGAQLTLYPGDIYTFSFTTLPDSSVGYFGYSPSGGVSIRVSDFDVNVDRLLFLMYEDTPDELSVAGGVVEAVTDGTALPDAFVDFQGGVYFHMLEGSVTLEEITFSHQDPVDEINSIRHTQTIIPAPIPEPSAMLLAAMGMVCLCRRPAPA